MLLAGCTKPPVAVPDAAVVEEECTLQTKLVPGVPGSPGHLLPSEINVNGASELAALMRTMKADLESAGVAIAAGKPVPPMHPRHRKMRCSWPTGLDDRNPVFEANAVSYLGFVRALDAKPTPETHDAVVGACLTCHATACPGPIPVIEKLRMLPK